MHQRRLPHWQPEGKDLFLTWRLQGSLPINRYIPPTGLTSGQAFVWVDKILDQAMHGPTWLSHPEIAAIITAALHHGEQSLAHYTLHAYVIMLNHVHALITPRIPLPKLMQSLKGYTAREANLFLGRTGHPFWQRESYDHWVRNTQEFTRIRAYIENNPVEAGLAPTPGQYPWSSAAPAPKIPNSSEHSLPSEPAAASSATS